jgi:cytochrome o ubiquinol oxidase subunit 2
MMLPATQKLEPQRAIESDNNELTIRVVAMRWKWLFMYPEQDIATVNFVQIPVDTPVRFELTADEAPMNGFWIPSLGGMLYGMTEHVNPLNLIAHTTGDYQGGASEINGHGFAGMRFTARVSSQEDFDKWASETAKRSNKLDAAEYEELLKPSEYNSAANYFSPSNQELFDTLLQKYAGGSHNHYNESESEGH